MVKIRPNHLHKADKNTGVCFCVSPGAAALGDLIPFWSGPWGFVLIIAGDSWVALAPAGIVQLSPWGQE